MLKMTLIKLGVLLMFLFQRNFSEKEIKYLLGVNVKCLALSLNRLFFFKDWQCTIGGCEKEIKYLLSVNVKCLTLSLNRLFFFGRLTMHN